MKDILLRYAAYNHWAHTTLVATLAKLTEKQWQKDLGSSFPSVYKTLLHMYQAEKLWWMRIQLIEPAQLSEKDIKPSTTYLMESLVIQAESWVHWLQKQNEQTFTEYFSYKNLKQQTFVQPFWEVQMHIFNHATFHRGQIITMLRQLGVQNVPATDFVVWTREI
ncbi:MAG: DinB family protein, partial [Chitinophagaceae bacterium]